MKKITILSVLLFIGLISLYSQKSTDTVTKLQIEQQLSTRIENVLTPYIGRCIVAVNLQMRYPTLIKALLENSNADKAYGDEEISRSKAAVISQRKKSFENEQTQILRKDVTVFTSETLSEKRDLFIKQNIMNLLNLNPDNGDVLVIKRILPSTNSTKSITPTSSSKKDDSTATSSDKVSTTNHWLTILSILGLIVMLIFVFIFKTTLNKLMTTRSNVSVTGFDKLIRLQGNMKAGTFGSVEGRGRQSQSSANKPVFVHIVEDKKDDELDDSLDFSYLENLSIDAFLRLIDKEKPGDIAGLLTNLSESFVERVFENYQGDVSSILKIMLKDKQKTKIELEKLHKQFSEKYKKMLEYDRLNYKSVDNLTKIINLMSPQKSKEIMDKILSIDKINGEKIRKNVLLIDDIQKMDDDSIEKIITSINHDLFIEFIMSAGDEIKQKFFKYMSPRAIAIAEEDIEIHGEISQEEKEGIIFEALNKIRDIMNYK